MSVNLTVSKTILEDILFLRVLYLQENNFQIRYNACHERGWSDSYLLTLNDTKIGYISIKGKDDLKDRDTIFEFYIIPTYSAKASSFFETILKVIQVKYIECQSNDFMLSSMLYLFADYIQSEAILFADHHSTNYVIPSVIFREHNGAEDIFMHKTEPIGDYVLEKEGEIVATGGYYEHYNKPFVDLYMEVREDSRKQGLGSYIIQELKKECYRIGKVPSARCNIHNIASKHTLIKSGFQICGFMLSGKVKSDLPSYIE